jgi:uracil-DNA glycosylase
VHWTGCRVITLGNEAFQWFEPYAEPGAAEAFWSREDRYEADLQCVLEVEVAGAGKRRKTIRVCPLPHPSPLNARWYKQFPALLHRRLVGVRAERP